MLTPDRPIPVEGSYQLRVRYVECDPMGVAHHSSYFPWMEMGRTELLRVSGVTYAQLEAAGVFLVLAKVELRYRRPIKYDDLLEIRTRIVGGGRVKIEHAYEISMVERDGRAPDPTDAAIPPDRVMAVGRSELACVGSDARIQAMPEWLVPRVE